MRPTKDEYIDSAHAEPGESGGSRPAMDAHDEGFECVTSFLIGAFSASILFAAGLVLWHMVAR